MLKLSRCILLDEMIAKLKHPRRRSTQRRLRVLEHARIVLREVVSGKCDPYEGYRQVYSLYAGTSGIAEELKPLFRLPGIDPDGTIRVDDDFRRLVVTSAAEWLRADSEWPTPLVPGLSAIRTLSRAGFRVVCSEMSRPTGRHPARMQPDQIRKGQRTNSPARAVPAAPQIVTPVRRVRHSWSHNAGFPGAQRSPSRQSACETLQRDWPGADAHLHHIRVLGPHRARQLTTDRS
jgi:hypothetical protein